MFEGILYIIYAIAAGIFVIGVIRLHHAFRRFGSHKMTLKADDAEHAPSVTVCIPARNESHAMTDCLQRVINSTYPKLEVIVLDDLSGDKTPALIKAFAHDGVRFVEGAPLPDDWLGKNHALNELLNEASGTYVLFMDVDTRLAPDSIEQLVAYARAEKAAMVSVLPRRDDGIRMSTLFSPLRYFWELMFHRKNAPAVASSAWMLDRQRFLDEYGGFESMKAAIQPEATIAARYMESGLYRFIVGTPQLGIAYEKKWQSQIDTSVRLLYPLLNAKITHAIVAVLDLLIVVLPVALLLAFIFTGWSVHSIGALVLYAAFAGLYGTYLHAVWRRGWILGALLWPVIVIQEAIIIIVSTSQYLRGRVTWKGRVVRLPQV